jgi:uncharacterized protein (TIGR01319 family)
MRANAGTIIERAGMKSILALANGLAPRPLTALYLNTYAERIAADAYYVPRDDADAAMDAAMAQAAIRIAMQRHAGRVREVYTAAGPALVQYGKDLGNVTTVIGVGGVLAHGRHARFALEGVVRSPEAEDILCPLRPRFLVDRAYILYAIGLIADAAPSFAFGMAKTLLSAPDVA